MKTLYTFIIVFISANCFAQSYNSQIAKHREDYKQEFLRDKHSPLKGDDIQFLKFYDADESFRVTATFKRTPDAKQFEMGTFSGQKKMYVQYGELTFKLKEKEFKLNIYQNISLASKPEYRDYLFVPFTDLTNGKESYGGGRYLDFRMGDIKNNQLIIDFNKTYNPYCAYSSGYSCPKPPAENNLNIAVEAGEKDFGKPH